MTDVPLGAYSREFLRKLWVYGSMGAKKKLKIKESDQAERAQRADRLKVLFDEAAPSNRTGTAPTLSDVLPRTRTECLVGPSAKEQTVTATVLTESQRRLQEIEREEARTRLLQHSRLYEKPHEATSLRTVVSDQPYSPARRIDVKKRLPPVVREHKSESNRGLGLVLLCAAIFVGFIGYWSLQRPRSTGRELVQGAHTVETTKDRIGLYQYQLGSRLNRQRVDTEVQNYFKAPSLSESDRPITTDQSTMMTGLPLSPTSVQDSTGVYSSRFQTTPLPPDHPDAHIYYGLEEEQHHDEFEKQATRAYVQDFLRNAEAQGYNVRLDKNLNVIGVEKNGRDIMRVPGSTSKSAH